MDSACCPDANDRIRRNCYIGYLCRGSSDCETLNGAYHDAALEEVNSLVRKYNGLAPYTVRRPYYVRSVELDKSYEECAESVHWGIMNRTTGHVGPGRSAFKGEDVVVDDQPSALIPPRRIRDVIRRWLGKLMCVLR